MDSGSHCVWPERRNGAGFCVFQYALDGIQALDMWSAQQLMSLIRSVKTQME
jgi:hypothetical protein